MINYLNQSPWQIIVFTIGLFIYAGFGSPTPDNFDITEVIIAVFLLAAININNILLRPIELIIFMMVLCVPLIIGFAWGNDTRDIVRDIVALGFIFMPLLYGDQIYKTHISLQPIVAICGAIFAARAAIPYYSILNNPDKWGEGPPADLLYLANSPEVVFAALIGIKYFFDWLSGNKNWQWAIFSIFLLLPPLLSMSLMMQRAGIGAVIIVALIYTMRLLYNRPIKCMMFLLCFIPIMFITYDIWSTVLYNLWHKTMLVGVNGRFAEWDMVFGHMNASFISFLLGIGWGAKFSDPAVAGLFVTYTHSLLSFLLLKTGVIGAFIIFMGIAIGVYKSFKQKITDLKFAIIFDYLPLIMPLLISTFLYANYKSIGFGLILCVFWDKSIRKLENRY